MQHSEFSHRTALISKEVCELLRAHDCVILPGFGGFVSGYAPASVHPVTHVFQPPHKHVLFNRNLKTDDGLLLNRLLPSLLLSYQEGRDWLTEYSEALHQRILAGERVSLGDLGMFQSDVERNILFRQQMQHNLLPDAFGLSSIQLQPIQRVVQSERVVDAALLPPAPVKRMAWGRWTSLAAASLLAAMWFFSPGNANEKLSALGIVPRPATYTEALRAGRVSQDARVREALPMPETPSNFSAEEAKIFVVAGCYSTTTNAQGMVSHLVDQGFNAYILDRTPAGLYRVVYGNYPDIRSASDELADIRRGMNEEAWLLVR